MTLKHHHVVPSQGKEYFSMETDSPPWGDVPESSCTLPKSTLVTSSSRVFSYCGFLSSLPLTVGFYISCTLSQKCFLQSNSLPSSEGFSFAQLKLAPNPKSHEYSSDSSHLASRTESGSEVGPGPGAVDGVEEACMCSVKDILLCVSATEPQ